MYIRDKQSLTISGENIFSPVVGQYPLFAKVPVIMEELSQLTNIEQD